MKRKIYSKLQQWKEQWHGRTALMVDGARRVGKSWIVEEFAKNEYESYILIDFNNPKPGVIELFEMYLSDLDTFFAKLEIYANTRLHHRQSVIIFDEVQMYPKARAAIKYLVQDGRYDYIQTGSLVSINHNVKDIVIPSEEMRIEMHPMDLEEFMWACDQQLLSVFIREQFTKNQPLGQVMHRKMMDILRTYMIVGGMPQAVLSWITNHDFIEVDSIKRTILALYRNDIAKYAGRQKARVTQVFDNIPGALQQHEKRFRPSKAQAGARMVHFAEAFFWLDESRVANFCYAATEPNVALALNRNDAKVKIYMADTGLLLSMAFSQEELGIGGIYEKILRDKLEFNKGMLTENLVAQMLKAAGHPLYFFTSSSRDDARERMEIDFLIRKANVTSRHNISPIEVKSSTNYSLSSLNKFADKYSEYVGRQYVLHSGDLRTDTTITYLPLYMTHLL